MLLFKIGLIINILVAGGFGISLINKKLHTKIYGTDNTSRQILSSLYLAIAIISILALINENYLKKTYYGIYNDKSDVPKLLKFLNITNSKHLDILDNRHRLRNGDVGMNDFYIKPLPPKLV